MRESKKEREARDREVRDREARDRDLRSVFAIFPQASRSRPNLASHLLTPLSTSRKLPQ